MSKAPFAKLALTAVVGIGALVGQATIAHAGPAPQGGQAILVNPDNTGPGYQPGVIAYPTTTTTKPKPQGPGNVIINGAVVDPPVDPPADPTGGNGDTGTPEPKPCLHLPNVPNSCFPTGGDDGGIVIDGPCQPKTHGPNDCVPVPDPCDVARINDDKQGPDQGDDCPHHPRPCDDGPSGPALRSNDCDPCEDGPVGPAGVRSGDCDPCGSTDSGPIARSRDCDPCDRPNHQPRTQIDRDDCEPCSTSTTVLRTSIGGDDCGGGTDGGTDGGTHGGTDGGTDGHEGRLPHTGADVLTYGAAGFGLVGLGALLRRLGKRGPSTS